MKSFIELSRIPEIVTDVIKWHFIYLAKFVKLKKK